MHKQLFQSMVLAVLVAIAVVPSWAQDDKRASREREVLRRAQQQVQQANQELAGVREKLDAAEAQRAELATSVERAQSRERAELAGRQRVQRELSGLSAERDLLKAQTEEQVAQIQSLNVKVATLERDLAASVQRSRQAQTEAESRQVQLAGRVEACEQRNLKLYATGRELIDQCRDRSASDAVLRLEPFSGMGRVDLENRLEAVRDQLDSNKTPATP
jgi:chromosome segregation ATPase